MNAGILFSFFLHIFLKGDEKMSDNEEKKNTGLTEKENEKETVVYMTDRQYMEHKYFQGRFFGVVSVIFGTVAEALRVFFSRLLFNKNERLDITEISKRAQKQDSKESWTGKGKEKETDQEKESERENEKGNKDRITPETRDRIANLMFHEQGVRKAFENIGIGAQPEQNAPDIYLFKQLGMDQGGLQSTVYVMPKEDLIHGKADALASALYAYGEGDKIDCALKSLITVGAIRYLCDQPLFERGQVSGNPVTLSELEIKTANGLEQISLRGSRDYKDAVEVIVNGEKTAILPVQTLKDQRYNDYRDELFTEVDKKMNPSLTIGEEYTLTLSRTHDGMTVLYTEKDKVTDLGCYAFKTEADVRSLIEEMKEANVDIKIASKEGTIEHMDPASTAYVIGILSNPDMQPDKADGKYLNTFTSEKELDGISHFNIERTKQGVQLNLFHPSKEEPERSSKVFEYRNFASLSPKDICQMVEAVKSAKEIGRENEYVAKDHSRNDLSALIQETGSAFHEPIIGANAHVVMGQYETEKVFEDIETPTHSQDIREQEAWKNIAMDPFNLELDESRERKEWDVFDNFKEDDPITCTDDPRMLNDPDYIRMQEEECRRMEEAEARYQEEMGVDDR